jgi:hypothetical protein
MIGPYDVIELKIGRREALLNPFGIRTVNKTLRTVTHGAGFPAGITSNTTVRLLFKKFPPLFRRHLFEFLGLMIGFFEWQFFHGISDHDIGADWVSMGTGLAGRIEEVIPL